MERFYVNVSNVPAELRPGVKEIADKAALSFKNKKLMEIAFRRGGDGVRLSFKNGALTIDYKELNDAFRGLGLANARSDAELKKVSISERRRMEKTYIMLDSSRNAVLNRASAREWLKLSALAGVNGFMFYTEDTFEVPGEELFGYMRGKLTIKELKEHDDLAASLGVEMIPCIQALAHMQRILQYGRYAAKYADTGSVMMCDDAETLKFIEKIIKAAVKPFRSKRVHIGMDEAWDLGRGAFLSKHGYVKPFDIMTKHLNKVMEITRRLGLKPMIWSDMFFRALSKHHGYYDTSVEVTDKMRRQIPKDVDLVYWDYYHEKESDYSAMIDKHVEMGQTPVIAPAAWAWNRFWVCHGHSRRTITPCIKTCLRKGVKEMIITIWGDDGAECDFFSALPLIQYASDYIFTGKSDLEYTRKNTAGLGINFDDWSMAGDADLIPPKDYLTNISKALLWEDPLLGLWQPQLNGKKFNQHFAKHAAAIKKVLGKKGNDRLMLPYLLSDLLSVKADLPTILRTAYLKKDKKKLAEIADKTLPDVARRIKKLNECHRALWLRNYKPFGWEVLERRYGGLLGMVEHTRLRLKSFLSGEACCLEELAEKRLPMADSPDYIAHMGSVWRVSTTGQFIHHQNM